MIAESSHAERSIDPHEGRIGSGSPRPRNDSVDSATIADPTASVVFTNTSGSTAGSTCLEITWKCPPPNAFDRSM